MASIALVQPQSQADLVCQGLRFEASFHDSNLSIVYSARGSGKVSARTSLALF